jgi:hypothetical protein
MNEGAMVVKARSAAAKAPAVDGVAIGTRIP